MLEATVHRPVTPVRLAALLGWKTFQVLAVLLKRGTFVAPAQSMDEVEACTISEDAGVTLHILDEDGSEDIPPSSPVPFPPSYSDDPDYALFLNLAWDDEFIQKLEDKIAASLSLFSWKEAFQPLSRLEAPPVTWRQPAGPDPDTLSPE